MSYSLSNGRRMVVRPARCNHADCYKITRTPNWFIATHNYDEAHSIKITFKEVEGANELLVKQLKQRT